MELNGNGKLNGHGGARNGAGRKPKADEVNLIEKLSPLDETAFSLIKEGLEQKDNFILKLFMAYRFGQPKETVKTDNINKNIEMIRLVDVDGTEF